MSESLQADVVVLGLGPGGEDVAGRLADAGLDVVGIDRELVGGECPYWGCVPSKMMIRAAHLLEEARRIPGMAGEATVRPDWLPLAQRVREEATDDWDDRVAVERFEAKGGRFLRGEGRIIEPRRVAVGDRVVEARRAIVVATGLRPWIPPIPGLDETPYWTNREAIEAKELPSSLVVLGGGALGAELAQAFARFGVDVDVVEAQERLLPLNEPEAGALIAEVFTGEGIAVRTSAEVTRVHHDGQRFTLEIEGGDDVTGDQLLVSTGRRADLGAIGVGALGIDESGDAVPVDERLRVTDGVWAVGDITGEGAFTHVAVYQAAIAAADILGEDHAAADYHALGRVTFTDPEVGKVGPTEREAREAGIRVAIGTARVPETARGWIHKAGNDGLIKLVADADRGVLVGATAMGPNGGEVLGLLSLAVHAEVPLATMRSMIYTYPTFHRGIEDALREIED